MSISISNFIFQKPILRPNHQFSPPNVIDGFFNEIPDKLAELWPLNLENEGFSVNYISVKIDDTSWKEDEHLLVQAEISNGQRKAIIEQEFQYGANDNMIINMKSLYCAENGGFPKGMGIARVITEKNFKFLQQFDKTFKPFTPSAIKTYASSERTRQKIDTYGGYIWAINGFEFEDKNELIGARFAFKKFLANRGIQISDKELNLFTKPCHFAAYGCGKMTDFKGKKYPLGKAFLCQHSWYGIQKTTAKNNVERKYANAYYNERAPELRRKNALKKLGKKYQTFIRNSYKKTLLQKIADRFKLLQRFTKSRLLLQRLG